jgi:hypothetical protein
MQPSEDEYTFAGGSKRPKNGGSRPREPLPPGDYKFRVMECGEPYKNNRGNWVLKTKLNIPVHERWIYFYPWSGRDSRGELRDGIGDFLKGIGVSLAVGEKPDWDSLVGKVGRARLKVETATSGPFAGETRNVIAFVFTPRELAPQSEDDDDAPDDLPW